MQRLITAICSGGVDAVTFTSAPAVEALFSVADADSRLEELHSALRSTVLSAAVGPVTAAPLVSAGILPIVPDRFRMGALIRLLCEHLERSALRIETATGPLEVRGSQVRLDGRRATLSPIARASSRPWSARTEPRSPDATSRTPLPAPSTTTPSMSPSADCDRHSRPPNLVQTVIKRGYRLNVA